MHTGMETRAKVSQVIVIQLDCSASLMENWLRTEIWTVRAPKTRKMKAVRPAQPAAELNSPRMARACAAYGGVWPI